MAFEKSPQLLYFLNVCYGKSCSRGTYDFQKKNSNNWKSGLSSMKHQSHVFSAHGALLSYCLCYALMNADPLFSDWNQLVCDGIIHQIWSSAEIRSWIWQSTPYLIEKYCGNFSSRIHIWAVIEVCRTMTG